MEALARWVQSKDEGGAVGARERRVVRRSGEAKPRTWHTLSKAHKDVELAEVVAAHGQRHGVEELFAEGCQEVGLNHDEVRWWLGWAHHRTLTLLALWFLQLERLRLGEKSPGGACVAVAAGLHGAVEGPPGELARDRRAGERGAAA